ncbi:MAG TPA: hypothetical protein VG737_03845 [Cyclobacteriaceae bacterium]|nr:hypothetical protein [Cyclobacteriaceae bacterium]
MVEVFKTDVTDPGQARTVVDGIRASFPGHEANFDLQDCDHILRVTSNTILIHPQHVIDLVAAAGHHAEVLADEYEKIEESLQMP